jgi:hypothetical protein
MITCPNCAHNNPDGAVNCEACFTSLPIVKHIQCPNCQATILSDAKFCGHCGFNLTTANEEITTSNELSSPLPSPSNMSNPAADQTTEGSSNIESTENTVPESPSISNFTDIENLLEQEANSPAPMSGSANLKTQLQSFAASLLHVQTNLTIEISAHLSVIHIGKPNTVIPPDVDVSGFPDSDIVSRIHADIRAEGGSFYLEDTGSSNGTYINNLPLPAGNRHKLRAGDRISLGKGDKVSFIFQINA